MTARDDDDLDRADAAMIARRDERLRELAERARVVFDPICGHVARSVV